jgi:hypothetical protein
MRRRGALLVRSKRTMRHKLKTLCEGLYANGLAVPLRLWYGVPLMGSRPTNPTQYNKCCARLVL